MSDEPVQVNAVGTVLKIVPVAGLGFVGAKGIPDAVKFGVAPLTPPALFLAITYHVWLPGVSSCGSRPLAGGDICFE